MKKYYLLLLILLPFLTLRAQEHEIHDRITSEVWEAIAGIKHKVVDDYEYYPIFPKEVKALEGRTVELKGYMVPTKDGFQHSAFLLSVLPISQCFFCGKNGIPMMIEVKLKKPISYTDKVIKVKGTMTLRQLNAAYYCPVVISNAMITN
jgi:hypothetical protein